MRVVLEHKDTSRTGAIYGKSDGVITCCMQQMENLTTTVIL